MKTNKKFDRLLVVLWADPTIIGRVVASPDSNRAGKGIYRVVDRDGFAIQNKETSLPLVLCPPSFSTRLEVFTYFREVKPQELLEAAKRVYITSRADSDGKALERLSRWCCAYPEICCQTSEGVITALFCEDYMFLPSVSIIYKEVKDGKA